MQRQEEVSKVGRLLGEEVVVEEAHPSLGEAAEVVVEEEACSFVVVLLILFRSARSPDATGFECIGFYRHIRQGFLRMIYNECCTEFVN